MAYRIEYSGGQKCRKAEEDRPAFGALVGLGMVTGLVLISLAWPRCLRIAQEILIPGEPGVTVAALGELQAALQEDVPLEEALTAFCRQVMEADPA